MSEHTHRGSDNIDLDQQRRDFRAYVWGLSLALPLTLLPFALVYWDVLQHIEGLIAISACALLQIVVCFRFFLHIGFYRKREDLQLILFSALLLMLMAAGTLWITTDLAQRMGMTGM